MIVNQNADFFSLPSSLFIKLTRHKIILLLLCVINQQLLMLIYGYWAGVITYHVYMVFMLLAAQKTILQ